MVSEQGYAKADAKNGVDGGGSRATAEITAEEGRKADALALQGRLGRELGALHSVRDVGMSSTSFPILTCSNYTCWSVLMKVIMEARHMWPAEETGDAEFAEDRLAMEAILPSVLPEMVPTLAVKKTAMEACDTIKIKFPSSRRKSNSSMVSKSMTLPCACKV